MQTSGFNDGGFSVISDGYKLVLVNGVDSWLFDDPFLTSYNIRIDRNMMDFSDPWNEHKRFMPGLMALSIDLTLRGGSVQRVDRPLIMGVDIFDKLSISDYLDVINEKIKVRP